MNDNLLIWGNFGFYTLPLTDTKECISNRIFYLSFATMKVRIKIVVTHSDRMNFYLLNVFYFASTFQ